MNVTGILSEIVVFSVLSLCRRKASVFDVRIEPMSYFGSLKETSKVFSAGILLYLVLRTLFIGQIIDHFTLWTNYWVVASYAVALCSVFLATIVTMNRFRLVHGAAARLGVVSSIAFLLFLSIALIKTDTLVAMFSFGVFLVLLIVGSRFFLRGKTTIVSQLYFLVPIILWDWVMTGQLFL